MGRALLMSKEIIRVAVGSAFLVLGLALAGCSTGAQPAAQSPLDATSTPTTSASEPSTQTNASPSAPNATDSLLAVGEVHWSGNPSTIGDYQLLTTDLIAAESFPCIGGDPLGAWDPQWGIPGGTGVGLAHVFYVNSTGIENLRDWQGACTMVDVSEFPGVLDVISTDNGLGPERCTLQFEDTRVCVIHHRSWQFGAMTAAGSDEDTEEAFLDSFIRIWVSNNVPFA